MSFTLEEVGSRIASTSMPDGDVLEGDFLLNPDLSEIIIAQAVKRAAVMIGMVEREAGINLVLTKRTEKLKSHAGQISFPGGKVDESDRDAVETALRETHEEIGVPNSAVEVLGALPNYYSASGYQITPVIGVFDEMVDFTLNPDEVDYLFEVPLSFLMDEKNHSKGAIMRGGAERFYFEMPYQNHHIWGVTAGIIAAMKRRYF